MRISLERKAELLERLAQLERERRVQVEASEKATKEQAEAERKAAATTAAHIADVEALTDAYKEQVATQEKNLQMQTAQLREARQEQASIEKTYQDLLSNITDPDISEVGLGDIFAKINQAAAKAEQGQADEAIAIAEQGADLLLKLKEKGTELDPVLAFLAKRLETIAKGAAESKVELEINGKYVNEAWECFAGPGKICLQSEGSPIEFRNVKLTPLKK